MREFVDFPVFGINIQKMVLISLTITGKAIIINYKFSMNIWGFCPLDAFMI